MAETTTVQKTAAVAAPKTALKAARAFVAKHGKPAKAVVQHVGRAGTRVVFVGQDGAVGDVIVPDPAAAEALIGQVEDLEPAEWDAPTTKLAKIGPRHRHRMAGPRLIRWSARPGLFR